MAHTFVVGLDHRTGSDLARCGDLRARSGKSCAARKLARALLEAGAAEDSIVAVGEDGQVRYTARSLTEFARWTYVENPKPHLVRYVKMVFRGRTVETGDEEGEEE